MSKKIDFDQMSSVKVDMSTIRSDISGSNISMTLTIEDDSRTKIEDCIASVKTCNTSLLEVAQNMDSYLNDIAQAFKEMDLQLSNNINANGVPVNHSGPNPYANKL